MKKNIYLDYNSTTPMHAEIADIIRDIQLNNFGNPSSIHCHGRNARKVLNESRKIISEELNCSDEQIIFTSGATESNNFAIKGLVNKNNLKNIFVAGTDHFSVLKPCRYLENNSIKINYIPVDESGLIKLSEFAEMISKADDILLCLTCVNNETGVIQRLDRIFKIIGKTKKNIFVHADAVQAVGKIELEINKFDTLSLSAHKIYGPKGTGLLFVKNPENIESIILGGGQEYSKRAGTENAAGIRGFAESIKLALSNIKKYNNKNLCLTNLLIDLLKKENMDFIINGDNAERVSNTLNLAFPGFDKNILTMNLDMNGISVSAGSACTAGAVNQSHVLETMGLEKEVIESSIRISTGYYTTEEEIKIFVKKIAEITGHRNG